MSITTGLGREEVGRNEILNGNFDLWARGTSTSSNAVYLADRWLSSGGCESYSRGTTTPPIGSTYYAIFTRTTASSGSLVLNQRIESANTKMLDGKTVTLSFQFRQTAGTTTSCKVRVDSADTVDTFSAITTQVAETTVLASPTSSWQTVSYTFAVNSTMATNGFQILIGNLVTTGPVTFNLSQVKLEVGSVATPFSLAGGDYAGELQKCMRYYELFSSGITGAFDLSTRFAFGVNYKVEKRVSPVLTILSNIGVRSNNNQISSSGNTVAASWVTTRGATLTVDGFTGGTGTAGGVINNSTAFMSADAEL